VVVKQIVFDHFDELPFGGCCNLITKRGLRFKIWNPDLMVSEAERVGLKAGDKIKISLDEIGIVTSWDFAE